MLTSLWGREFNVKGVCRFESEAVKTMYIIFNLKEDNLLVYFPYLAMLYLQNNHNY